VGCNFSSTAPVNTSKNIGIEVFNTDLIVKEFCPRGCPLHNQIFGLCDENCLTNSTFSGFNQAVSASNSGVTPVLKVRYTNFANNYIGISVDGINYHQLIKNKFDLTQNSCQGISVNNATGYKIEENEFYDSLPAPNKRTIGLAIYNSGTPENEVYKNSFKNLYAGQNFLRVNEAIASSVGKKTGLQTLCNTFINNQYRDIHVGSLSKLPMFNDDCIKWEQGSLLLSSGNTFSGAPLINIDNTKSQLSMNYYHGNTANEYPSVVSNNVTRLLSATSNGCPSKAFTGGGIPDKASEEWNLENALAQYNEWNAQYEYWLARAKEECGEKAECGKQKAESGDEGDECSMIWSNVSHYSALKDNYFNAIIVAEMHNYEFDDEMINQSKSAQSELSEFQKLEKLRFLFTYRNQYTDNLSITETFLAENNYPEALATLSQMYDKFKLNEEQRAEVRSLEIYTRWLQQLNNEQNSIYTLSENELEYLTNYAATNTGRGVVFAKNILCGLYGICIEDEMIRRLDDEMMRQLDDENQSKSAQSVSSEFQKDALENIKIYPNPTQNIINIENNSNIEITNISLIDIYGRTIKQYDGYVNQIDVSNFHSGLYFLKIRLNTGKEIIQKILHNK